MQHPDPQKPPTQSTSFLGGPQRWPTKPPVFTGGFSWINKDASNVKSKSHIATVRAHVRNEYRYWKPGDSPKPSKAQAKTTRGSDSSPPVERVSSDSPLSTGSSGISSSSKGNARNDSSATSLSNPKSAASTKTNSPQQISIALVSSEQYNPPRRSFFDPVRGSVSVLETISDPRKAYERRDQQQAPRVMPGKLADPAKLISDAKARAAQANPAPAGRSKHESGKLLRGIRDFNGKQAALQNRSLQTSIGSLRDDPFLSFPI